MTWSEDSLKTLPPWMEKAASEAWEEAQRIRRTKQRVSKYSRYVDNPVGFGRDILKEDYTSDIEVVMASVVHNPVTIVRSSNAVGKTHGAARVAWWFFSVFEDSQVYVTSAPPYENLKKLLWGELMSIKYKHPGLFEGLKQTSMNIYRHEKSFITGVPIPTTGTIEEREAKFSGKHAPHLLFIVDEGDAVPDEVYKGIDSCMTGGDARLLILFNPRAQSGPVYYRESNSLGNVIELSAFNHPNVTTGEDMIPGAVSRNTILRRIHDWTRPLTAGEDVGEECFKVPRFLVGQPSWALDGREYPPLEEGYRKVKEPAFYYMVLGVYPPQGTHQLINTEDISRARSRWDAYVAAHGRIPPFGVRPRLGLDVAEYGIDSNCLCPRYGGFVDEIITWAGVDVDTSAREAMHWCVELDADLLLVDGTGIGAGIAPSVVRLAREKHRKEIAAMTIKVAESPSPIYTTEVGEFKRLRDQIWWLTREWLAKEDAMLPPDPLLIEELKTPSYTVKNGKIEVMDKEKMRKILKRSPDRAESLGLTLAPFERAKMLRAG